MRFKLGGETPSDRDSEVAGDERSGRIRADLERRGVAPEASQTFATVLTSLPENLSPQDYESTLDRVVLAWTAQQRESAESGAPQGRDLDELSRLMQGFGAELRKLEEALQILSAYVTRMRTRADGGYTLQ